MSADPNEFIEYLDDLAADHPDADYVGDLWHFPLASAAYTIRDYRSLDGMQYAFYNLLDAAEAVVESGRNTDGTLRRSVCPVRLQELADLAESCRTAEGLRAVQGLPAPSNDFNGVLPEREGPEL